MMQDMLTESRSQSRKMSCTLMKFMDVSPFVHNEDRERLKNVAFLVDIVFARASLLANPCIRMAPVSTFCAIATANPLLSHFTLSSNVSTWFFDKHNNKPMLGINESLNCILEEETDSQPVLMDRND